MIQTAQQTVNSNVVSFAAFKSAKQSLPTPIDVVEINGKQYERPKTGDEYLHLIRDVLLSSKQEDDYREILCCIMDEEFYKAQINYANSGKADSGISRAITGIVDAYLSYFE